MLIPFEMSERTVAWAQAHGFQDMNLLIETALRRLVRRRGSKRRRSRAGRGGGTPVSLDAVAGARERLSRAACRQPLPAPADVLPYMSEERLWGQVNRLAPVKLVVRGLAVAAAGKDGWPRFKDVARRLAADVAALGSALAVLDAQAGRKRDDQLATGLPRHDNPASQERFLAQYLVRATQKGELHPGAASQFGVVVLDGDRLLLTDAGIRLAMLPSPLLDGPLEEARETLTAAERQFFLEQVVERMPAEQQDANAILATVAAGIATPEGLLEAVRSSFPCDWSTLTFRTHVGGIIARLVELGLLVRYWVGRHVRYAIRDLASAASAELVPAPKYLVQVGR